QTKSLLMARKQKLTERLCPGCDRLFIPLARCHQRCCSIRCTHNYWYRVNAERRRGKANEYTRKRRKKQIEALKAVIELGLFTAEEIGYGTSQRKSRSTRSKAPNLERRITKSRFKTTGPATPRSNP